MTLNVKIRNIFLYCIGDSFNLINFDVIFQALEEKVLPIFGKLVAPCNEDFPTPDKIPLTVRMKNIDELFSKFKDISF